MRKQALSIHCTQFPADLLGLLIIIFQNNPRLMIIVYQSLFVDFTIFVLVATQTSVTVTSQYELQVF